MAFFDSLEENAGATGDMPSPHSLASKVAAWAPSVYTLSIPDNLAPTAAFLGKIWGGSNEVLRRLWRRPTVLLHSLEGNIQPTMNFFNRTGYTDLRDDWELVPGGQAIVGSYLTASLFNRLLPRWHFVRHLGEAEDEDTVPPTVSVLATATDKKFCTAYGTSVVEYETFRTKRAAWFKSSWESDTWLETGRDMNEQNI